MSWCGLKMCMMKESLGSINLVISTHSVSLAISRMVLKFVYTSITLNNLCLHSAFSHVQILAGVIIIINLVVSVS